MYAAKGGHTKAVELLLQHGADINAKNFYGYIHSIYILYRFVYLSFYLYDRLILWKYFLNSTKLLKKLIKAFAKQPEEIRELYIKFFKNIHQIYFRINIWS